MTIKQQIHRTGMMVLAVAITTGMVALAPVTIPKAEAAEVVRGSGSFGNLGELVVLEKLFDNNSNSDLTELIVFESLFNRGINRGITGTSLFSGANGLTELILLEELFDNGSGVFGGRNNLRELILFEELFGGGVSGGILGRSGNTVRVESGDTLRGISSQFLGNPDRFGEIVALNSIANPDLIRVGELLRLPNNGVFGGGNLGELVILGELFDGGNGVFGGRNNLRELILFEELFGGGGGVNNIRSTNSLLELFLLENLFDNSDTIGADSGTRVNTTP